MSETPVLQEHPCDACGQSDTAPMIHVAYGSYQKDERTTIAEPSFHNDCLPADLRAQVFADPVNNAVTIAAIEAAESGIKGDDLREFIQAQPNDNNLDEEN